MQFFFIHFIIFFGEYILLSANPIVGENVRNAEEGEFPSVVSIKHINPINKHQETDHKCTGTLISNWHVLTAEHCSRYFEGQITEVVVGSVNIRRGIKYYAALWITFNEWTVQKNKSREFQDNDIAIIRLTKSVHQSIQIAVLSNLSRSALEGKDIYVAVFGRKSSHSFSRYLKLAMLKIITRKQCEKKLEKILGEPFPVERKYVCGVSDPVTLLSPGNSGSPAFYNQQLVGFAKGTCPSLENMYDPRKINLFLTVTYYKEFILDVILNI